jgi:hypothetical protein
MPVTSDQDQKPLQLRRLRADVEELRQDLERAKTSAASLARQQVDVSTVHDARKERG